MRTDIKFAGMAFSWTEQYAYSYSEKLNEMGFCSKVMVWENLFIVGYSYRPFSRNDASIVLLSFKRE